MTQTVGSSTGDRPALWGRRFFARLIDALLAVALSAVVVWPSAWSAALDALAGAGFEGARDFLDAWDADAAAGSAAGQAADALQPVVLGAVMLQTLVIWLYETLSTTVASTTPGKAFNRLRVQVHHGLEPVPTVGDQPRRSWAVRLLRMGLRAALVVVPPALAVGMTLAGGLGAAEAAAVAEVAIAVSAVMGVLALVGSAGLHGLLTGTRVVGFSWAELRGQAERCATEDDYLAKLRAAADQSPAARRAREEMDAASTSGLAKQGRVQATRVRGRDPQELLQQGRQALAARGIKVSDERAREVSATVDSFLSRGGRAP
jgi:hypothetical protein